MPTNRAEHSPERRMKPPRQHVVDLVSATHTEFPGINRRGCPESLGSSHPVPITRDRVTQIVDFRTF